MYEANHITVPDDTIKRREVYYALKRFYNGLCAVIGETDATDILMHIPPAEERTCQNVQNEIADCDWFICSECGIDLMDWVRRESDEDGDETFHEYVFRYCPNCGARIIYGD